MFFTKTIKPGSGPIVIIGAFISVFLLNTMLSTCQSNVTNFVEHESYSQTCTSDTIDAEITKEGHLHIVETKTYEFKGAHTQATTQVDPTLLENLTIHGVTTIDQYGNHDQLKSAEFKEKWRDGIGQTRSGAFSFDEENNTIYAFSAAEDESKTFIFDYTFKNVVKQYSDVNAVKWQIVTPGERAYTKTLAATVQLPTSSTGSDNAEETINAYASIKLASEIDIDQESRVVTYTIQSISNDENAECVIAFPLSWISDSAAAARYPGDYLPVMEENEQQERERAEESAVDVSDIANVISALMGIIILAAFILFLRFSKEHRVQFKEKYWKDIPHQGVHPALVGRIDRWGESKNDDIAAALIHLHSLGAIGIKRVRPDEQESGTYLLERNTEYPQERLDNIDIQTLSLIFAEIGGGADEVTFKQIDSLSRRQPQKLLDATDEWQNALGQEMERRGYLEKTGAKLQKTYIILAGILLLSTIANIIIDPAISVIWDIGAIFCIFALYMLSKVMARRSPEASEIHAKSRALKRWLRGLDKADETLSDNGAHWADLLAHATVFKFNLAERTALVLYKKKPNLWNDESFCGDAFWYCNPDAEYEDGHATHSDTFCEALCISLHRAEELARENKGFPY